MGIAVEVTVEKNMKKRRIREKSYMKEEKGKINGKWKVSEIYLQKGENNGQNGQWGVKIDWFIKKAEKIFFFFFLGGGGKGEYLLF
jgi:valyl-tRNA synthetase